MQPIRDNSRILTAALVGTAVEFYDFYIYATAAALVFGPLFFPAESPAAPKRLTLKRKGSFIVLTWPRDRLAVKTLVGVKSSNGLNFAKTVKRPTLRLKAPPAGSKLTITLAGTSKTGVLGKTGRFTRTLPKPKAAKQHKAKKVVKHR